MESLTHLTAEQRDFWLANGYLILERVFTESEVQTMRGEADFILELVINSSLCHQRHSSRLDMRINGKGQMVVRKIQPIIDLSLALAKFSQDDRLLGPMCDLMGDEPILMEEKLNYKQPVSSMPLFRVPADDDRFPIHNDWAYYLHNGYPDTIVSSAITVDDCTEENGSLQVFAGTHQEHIDHERVRNGLEVPEGSVDLAKSRTLIAPAGSVMLFHSKLVHTSQPNQTSKPRRVMIYSHYPQKANMGIDIRNGPNRLRESPWEWEYLRLKDSGTYADEFRLTHRTAD